MSDTRPSRRRRWLVPVVLLGAGAWVVARRRPALAVRAPWRPAGSVPAAAPDVLGTAARNGVAHPPTPTEPSVGEPPATAEPTTAVSVDAQPGGVEPPAAELLVAEPVAPEPVAPEPPVAEPGALGSAAPLPDGSAPSDEYTIKGNAGSMLFHPPSSPYYRRTRAEVWFRTPDDAVEAGFRPYVPRRRASG